MTPPLACVRRRAVLAGASLLAVPLRVRAASAPVELAALDDFAIVRSAGRSWLVGELVVNNRGTVPLALRALRAAASGMPALALPAAALQAAGARADRRPLERPEIGAGEAVTLYLWHALAGTEVTDAAMRLVLSTDGGDASLDVVLQRPVTLQAPLRGGPWVAVYDPLFPFGHRRSAFERDGRRHIPARFAVDWIRLDMQGRPAPEGAGFERWLGLGADVLAVADGRAVMARDGRDDVLDAPRPAGRWAPEDVAGNAVCLDIGGGRFVFYEHLKRGSLRVADGQGVRAGQVIGQVGRSGVNSSGPHLHFHVASGPSLLHAQGRPWALAAFRVLGDYAGMEAAEAGRPWRAAPAGEAALQGGLPPPNAVLQFG